MMRLISAIVIVGAIAWATLMLTQSSAPTQEPWVDPLLEQYVIEWKADMQRAGIDYERGLNRIERIIICADCKAGYSDRGDHEIAVSMEQLMIGPYSARGTIYHELGHSVFNLQHGSCNIMQSTSPTEEELTESWSEFTEEYLTHCKNNWYEARF
jgi:hypothetical protein